MSGIVTFPSLAAAVRAGFQVYDCASGGYSVRTKTAAGWALAIVELRNAHS